MRSPLFKPLFWLAVGILAALSLFVMLLSPVIGLLLLLLSALGFMLVVLLKPELWQAVKPVSKKKPAGESHNSRSNKQPFIMLESCSGDNENIMISKPMFVIGRAPDSDYQFRNGNGVGFHHCRITYRETTRQYFIEDLDSTYGTFLNGRRLNKNTPVPMQRNSIVAFHTHRYMVKPVDSDTFPGA